MNKLLLAFLLLSFTSTLLAKEFALGIVVGTPTGLSGKYTLSTSNIVQADISGGYSSVDYMWIDHRNFDVDELKWLYGIGAVINKNPGMRAVTATEYNLKGYPFHLIGNLSFTVANGTHVGVAGGARYDF
jgi:hypothetical protein